MTLKGVYPHLTAHGFFFECPGCGIDLADGHHVHADECPCRVRSTDARCLTPRQVLAKAMQERLKGDYGHDLLEIDFYDEADETIGALLDAGFAIVEATCNIKVGTPHRSTPLLGDNTDGHVCRAGERTRNTRR